MLLPAVALVSSLSERSPLPDCLAPIPIAQAPLIQVQRPPSGEDGPTVQLMLLTVPPGVRAGEQICVSAKGQLFMAAVYPGMWDRAGSSRSRSRSTGLRRCKQGRLRHGCLASGA